MIKISRDAELDFAYDISKSYLEKISLSIKNRSAGDPVRFVYDDKIEKETLEGTTEGALGSTINFPTVNLTISSSSQISS